MQYEQLRYVPESEDPSLTIETDELVVKVIDNTGLLAPPSAGKAYFNASHVFTPFVHHLGYHGIRTLYSKSSLPKSRRSRWPTEGLVRTR